MNLHLLIEAVYTFTSATYEKRRTKLYKTPFGTFTYRDVPSNVYPYEIILKSENGYRVAIAAPEKALCDLLYTISPRKNLKELRALLFDDLRLDHDDFKKLNMSHDFVTFENKKNSIKGIVHEIVLCGLSRAGFFKTSALYGGTALRIFHGLDRFSEDLDFSLMTPDASFKFDNYIPTLEKGIGSYGLNFLNKE